jgi:hypothetical protein
MISMVSDLPAHCKKIILRLVEIYDGSKDHDLRLIFANATEMRYDCSRGRILNEQMCMSICLRSEQYTSSRKRIVALRMRVFLVDQASLVGMSENIGNFGTAGAYFWAQNLLGTIRL